MNKKLPNVFVKKENIKEVNKSVFYDRNEPIDKNVNEIDSLIVKKKISDLLNSTNFVYKIDATVKLKDETKDITIVGKKNNFLILIDGSLLNIDDIIDINKK